MGILHQDAWIGGLFIGYNEANRVTGSKRFYVLIVTESENQWVSDGAGDAKRKVAADVRRTIG
jgi:hypothetical protein